MHGYKPPSTLIHWNRQRIGRKCKKKRHAQFILRCLNMFSIQGDVISDQFYPLKFIWFWVSLGRYRKKTYRVPQKKLPLAELSFGKYCCWCFVHLWKSSDGHCESHLGYLPSSLLLVPGAINFLSTCITDCSPAGDPCTRKLNSKVRKLPWHKVPSASPLVELHGNE